MWSLRTAQCLALAGLRRRMRIAARRNGWSQRRTHRRGFRCDRWPLPRHSAARGGADGCCSNARTAWGARCEWCGLLAAAEARGVIACTRPACPERVAGAARPRATSRHIHRHECGDDDVGMVASDARNVARTPRVRGFDLRNFAQIGLRASLQAVRELNARACAVATWRAVSGVAHGRRCGGRRDRAGAAVAARLGRVKRKMYN